MLLGKCRREREYALGVRTRTVERNDMYMISRVPCRSIIVKEVQ
jgi:hypothetical protein